MHTFSETSVPVGTRDSPALSRTLQIHVPQTGRKRGVRGGTSWGYKEIHKRSAIGKSNLLDKKGSGSWEMGISPYSAAYAKNFDNHLEQTLGVCI